MKNKFKATHKANTVMDMFKLTAKSGDTCEVSGKYYRFDGKDWADFKPKK